jgi:hypothetical protein
MNQFLHEQFKKRLGDSKLLQAEGESYSRLEDAIAHARLQKGGGSALLPRDERHWMFLSTLLTFEQRGNPQADLERLRKWWKVVYEVRRNLTTIQLDKVVELAASIVTLIQSSMPDGWYSGCRAVPEHQAFVNAMVDEYEATLEMEEVDFKMRSPAPESDIFAVKQRDPVIKILVDFSKLPRFTPCFQNPLFITLTNRIGRDLHEMEEVRAKLNVKTIKYVSLEDLECLNRFQHVHFQRSLNDPHCKEMENKSFEKLQGRIQLAEFAMQKLQESSCFPRSNTSVPT